MLLLSSPVSLLLLTLPFTIFSAPISTTQQNLALDSPQSGLNVFKRSPEQPKNSAGLKKEKHRENLIPYKRSPEPQPGYPPKQPEHPSKDDYPPRNPKRAKGRRNNPKGPSYQPPPPHPSRPKGPWPHNTGGRAKRSLSPPPILTPLSSLLGRSPQRYDPKEYDPKDPKPYDPSKRSIDKYEAVDAVVERREAKKDNKKASEEAKGYGPHAYGHN